MLKKIIVVTITILTLINLSYSKGDCECNKSTWFWNDEIKEKKQFIRDFMENPDSLIYPEFYEKYKSFRISNGFIKHYKKFFTGTGSNSLQGLFKFLIFTEYKVHNGSKYVGHQPTEYLSDEEERSWRAYKHDMYVRFGKIKTARSDCFSGNDKDYIYIRPEIYFRWYCKNGEWVLVDINVEAGQGYGNPVSVDNFDDW